MQNQFRIKLYQGPTAVSDYQSLTAKDPKTLYIVSSDDLDSAYLYLGNKPIDIETHLEYVFLRDPKRHYITQEELSDDKFILPENTKVGDTGILFTNDYNNTEDNDETYTFVNLNDLVNKYYPPVASNENSIYNSNEGLIINKTTNDALDLENPDYIDGMLVTVGALKKTLASILQTINNSFDRTTSKLSFMEIFLHNHFPEEYPEPIPEEPDEEPDYDGEGNIVP